MFSRRLVLVHAHPDDEALGTGGMMAKYSDEGAHVCLVTCTNGELGEVAEVPELGTVAEITARLGEVRIAELHEACRRLGDIDLRMLGYRDSGMEGTDGNSDPRSFVNQDMERPVRDVVAVLREIRPQVLVTYNDFGFYGHPDHIRAHHVAMAAVREAADEAFAPDLGPPHEVAKVYHTAVAKSFFRSGRDLASQMGLDPDDVFDETTIDTIGTDDALITTWIDASAYVDRKFDALEAHRTQRGTTEMFLSIPKDVRAQVLGTEHYVLVSPVPAGGLKETDLFEGTGV
jgi:N-acetyl-1-D-myo-inositol-2-amino-2-deoxy-alpha-D-glucopyranoside deacetylase